MKKRKEDSKGTPSVAPGGSIGPEVKDRYRVFYRRKKMNDIGHEKGKKEERAAGGKKKGNYLV